MLLEMPTEHEEEMRDEWVNHQVTVIKVKDNRYLMHLNVRATDASAQWFLAGVLATHMHKAP